MSKYILAFDSFKGCLSAEKACRAAKEAIAMSQPDAEVVCLPMSDGGEGMVECLRQALPLQEVSVEVHGPLMEPREAHYAISDDGIAYMEMASASGLMLVPEGERNPLITTTYGVGEMLLDATKRGCHEVVMGIGGSATCDGGKGMVDALLTHLKHEHGKCLIEGVEIKVTVASDVDNPLYGPRGAAYVFAPQKGADEEQVALLDERLRDFALQTQQAGYAQPELALHPGAGAAGGLGYGLMAYLRAELRSGIEMMLDVTEFDRHLEDADEVWTGEGKSDRQTLMGKVAHGILQRAQRHGVPVSLVSGSIEDREQLLKAGFSNALSINAEDHRPLHELLREEVALSNLRKTIEGMIGKEK